MLKLAETTIGTVRRISSELRPNALDDLGLVAAIEWYAQQFQTRTAIIVQCDCTLENLDLSREESTAVFRIFQEALTNILRHAQATRIHIQTSEEDAEFILTITDNGRGITTRETLGTETLGLLGMRERAHLVGGRVNIAGNAGQGTVVTIRVPVSSPPGPLPRPKHG
jgi:signal transduction histidine kinase